jgi:hypothetical protein
MKKNQEVISEAVEVIVVNPNIFSGIDVTEFKNAGELTKALKKATSMPLPLKMEAMRRFSALEAERKEAAREAKLLSELTGVYRSAATTYEQRLMQEFRQRANALANASFTDTCKETQRAAFITGGGLAKDFVYDAVQRDADGNPIYKVTASGEKATKAESVIRLLSLNDRRESLIGRIEAKRRENERDLLLLEIAYLENEKKMKAQFGEDGNEYAIVDLSTELAMRGENEPLRVAEEAHQANIEKLQFAVKFALDSELKAADYGIAPEVAINDIDNETAF